MGSDYSGLSVQTVAKFTKPLEGISGLDGAVLKFVATHSSSLESDDMYDIELSCTYQSKNIALLRARLVHRFQIVRGYGFYDQMDAVSNDCANLAVNLFARNGTVKKKWINNPVLKGLGRWTSEDLDSTDFLVIESIQVDIDHRRKGIGKVMMNTVLEWGREKGAKIAFLWATELNTAPDASGYGPDAEAVWQANISRSMAFCRSVGFRRVGVSHWFCQSTVRGPPAWAAEEDFDPAEGSVPEAEVVNTDGLSSIMLLPDRILDRDH